jgi:hypothetical protein
MSAPMSDTSQLSDITHIIQLAVAPVFLLSALGTTMSVLVTRLSRVIDRARVLEGRWHDLQLEERKNAKVELDTLALRGKLIHRALTGGVFASLAVCLLIIAAFIGYLTGTNLGVLVIVLFIGAMTSFAVALVMFLREVFFSLDSLRFGKHAVVEDK